MNKKQKALLARIAELEDVLDRINATSAWSFDTSADTLCGKLQAIRHESGQVLKKKAVEKTA